MDRKLSGNEFKPFEEKLDKISRSFDCLRIKFFEMSEIQIPARKTLTFSNNFSRNFSSLLFKIFYI